MLRPKVALITLGCARNEVDSEELAGSLAAGEWELVDDPRLADAIVVNTCGFIEAAKAESIDTLLAAADMIGEPDTAIEAGGGAGDPRRRVVVAAGCLAERYGKQLADELPEAAAVLGFDAYPDIDSRLRAVLAGESLGSHEPVDRRRLLPIAPVDRQAGRAWVPGQPGPSGEAGPRWNDVRRRLGRGPVAALKIASGCDRRCTFCAIPSFRGAFVSRPVAQLCSEAAWLASQGVRELVLVSENSTSYGKDLGQPGLLADLLSGLHEVAGLDRLRVSYLQPAELRPLVVRRMVELPLVADYFDLSFQHASPSVLRAMRRFGGTADFLRLIEEIRELSPGAGIRSNFIVGFPGESAADLAELESFLAAAQLDAIGIFGYSDEDGTAAANLAGKLAAEEIRERVENLSVLAEELMSQRAEDRVGETVDVLVESVAGVSATGRAGFQGPEDGETRVLLDPSTRHESLVGTILSARVVSSDGVDLHAVEVIHAHV